MVPQFVDVSAYQPATIDWIAYRKWAAQWDGIARVAMRSSYGTGFIDQHLSIYRAAALANNVDQIIYYHYAYPSFNSPEAEADWQESVVGRIRPQDILALDIEENVPQANSAWTYAWLARQETNYGKLPRLYASSAYIQARLQDSRLAKYPLWLANWQFSPDERPPVPLPWTQYEFVQYTDRATNIPGIAGTVDANIVLGKASSSMTAQVPRDWADPHPEDPNGTLTAPNGVPVKLGFRQAILNWTGGWDPQNVPLCAEYHVPIVQFHAPEFGGGQILPCQFGMFWYTPAKGVIYEKYLGWELKSCYDHIGQLEQQISQLQAQIAQLQGGDVNALKMQVAALQQQLATAKASLSQIHTLSEVPAA